MKNLHLILFLFVVACAGRQETQQASTPQDSVATTPTDSIQPTHVHEEPPSGTFVGFVKSLEETDEMYVPVFNLDNHTELNWDSFDSLVYKDEGYTRYARPLEGAEKYLHLAGMDTLHVYDQLHRYLGAYPLRRLELISTEIESYAVLVYKAPPQMNHDEVFYGMTSRLTRTSDPTWRTEPFEDDALTRQLSLDLALDTALAWEGRHCKVGDATIFSTLSAMEQSYLIKRVGESSSLMMSVQNDFHFGSILPIPFLYHGEPLILANYFVPETDIFGDLVIGYTDGEYRALPYGRVEK